MLKGDGQTWAEAGQPVLSQLRKDIETAERGDDAYKRWPVDTMRAVEARLLAMQGELDKRDP